MSVLLVLGGTGVLGRRIARLARESGAHERVLVGSRRASGEDAVALDVHDGAALARALARADVVIDAIGPFDYDPRPIVAACAEQGAAYVDIAETERFIDAATDEARRRGATAVSGASTVPGLVEVLARGLASPEVARVRAYLAVGTANEASEALIASMLAPLGRPIDGAAAGRAFGALVRVRHRGLGERVYGRYPSGADRAGLELDGRRVPLELFFGCDRALYAHALRAASRALGRARGLGSLAARAAMPLVPLMRRLGTPAGVLRVTALDDRGAALAAVEVRARENGLDVPALPAVWAAGALRGRTGALRLADLIDAREAVARLRAAGFEVIDPARRGAEETTEAWEH